MGEFSSTLGALLIAVLLNTYLYGLVTTQYLAYFNHLRKHRDPIWIRVTIGVLFITDTFHSICIIYMAWVYAVDGFNNPMALMQIIWPFPLSAIMMTFTAFVVQLFLAYRVLLFTQRYAISIPLALLSVGSFVAGMIVGVEVWLADTMLQLSTVNTVLTFWLSSEAATDVLISAILLFTLHASKTGFAKSDQVVSRLMRTSLQTGLFTAVFAIMCMVLFLTCPGTQLYLIFGLPISRVYTSTLLDTLTARDALRSRLAGADTYIGSGVFGLKTASSGSVLQFASRTVRQDVENVDTGRTASPKAIHDLELVHTRLYTESKSIGGGRGLCSTCANEKTTNAQH